jgi:predicted dehydrogenase
MSILPVRVGVIGLGRSGWDIHVRHLSKLPQHYQIVAVADPDGQRRQEAVQTLSCRAYAAVPEMLRDQDVEFVVVASPSYLHAAHTVMALEAGKAVVSEKPMAGNLADADSMIAAAARTGKLLTLFQNRRYDPGYLKVKEVVASGKLGRIIEIKMTAQSFGRRWDWQTINAFAGGILRNNGVHFLDQALQLMGPVEPQVLCVKDLALALGDAEDHVKLIMHAPGAPLVDLELTAACAYPHDFWLVMGTQGTLTGAYEQLRWKYFRPEEAPPRTLSTEPTPDRSYNRDQLHFYEETWAASANDTPSAQLFYLDLYRTLREGAPLAVTPASVRRVMQVLEQCK